MVTNKTGKNGVSKISKNSDGEVVYWKNGDKTFCPYNDPAVHYPAVKKGKIDILDFNPDSLTEEICYVDVSQGLGYTVRGAERVSILNKAVKKNKR